MQTAGDGSIGIIALRVDPSVRDAKDELSFSPHKDGDIGEAGFEISLN